MSKTNFAEGTLKFILILKMWKNIYDERIMKWSVNTDIRGICFTRTRWNLMLKASLQHKWRKKYWEVRWIHPRGEFLLRDQTWFKCSWWLLKQRTWAVKFTLQMLWSFYKYWQGFYLCCALAFVLWFKTPLSEFYFTTTDFEPNFELVTSWKKHFSTPHCQPAQWSNSRTAKKRF